MSDDQYHNDETKMITIPVESLKWLTVEGFINHYLTYVEKETTLKGAYELADKDFQNVFKKRRYQDYSNFLKSKWKYQARILKKNKTQPNEIKSTRNDQHHPTDRTQRKI